MQAAAVRGDESLKVAEFWMGAIAGVEKSFPSSQKHTHMLIMHSHTHTHRHSPVGDKRKRKGTAAGSERHWVSVNDVMGSPFSRA